MSHRQRRDREEKSNLSHVDRAKLAIRQAYQPATTNTTSHSRQFDFHLYENEHDRQERIGEIIDDEDGDMLLARQAQQPTSPIMSDRTTRVIEANDRRHDAVIFGDKATEEQQKNQLWDSFKHSSKYATTSLAGPLLLEDSEAKRRRWKTSIRNRWMKVHGISDQTVDVDVA